MRKSDVVVGNAKIVHEVEEKEDALALLELEMKRPLGRFCGAKRSKLVVGVDEQGGVTTTTKKEREASDCK